MTPGMSRNISLEDVQTCVPQQWLLTRRAIQTGKSPGPDTGRLVAENDAVRNVQNLRWNDIRQGKEGQARSS